MIHDMYIYKYMSYHVMTLILSKAPMLGEEKGLEETEQSFGLTTSMLVLLLTKTTQKTSDCENYLLRN